MTWRGFIKDLGFLEGVVSGVVITALLGIASTLMFDYFGVINSRETAAWAAAIATTSAALIALWLGLADLRRRREDRVRKSRFLLQATAPEMRRLNRGLVRLLVSLETLMNGSKASFDRGLPYQIPEITSRAIDASVAELATPMLDRLWLDLKDIEDDLGLDAAYVATELPRVLEWAAMVPRYPDQVFNPIVLLAHAELAAAGSAEVGVRVCNILRKINQGVSDRHYRDYLARVESSIPSSAERT